MEKDLNRSQIAALKAYPVKMVSGPIGYEEPKFDINGLGRTIFIEGYEQAEKDLALTWEDIAKIDHHIIDVNNEMAVDSSKEISRQKFYEEVLKRFNAEK